MGAPRKCNHPREFLCGKMRCRECFKKQQHEYYRKTYSETKVARYTVTKRLRLERLSMLATLKIARGCIDCGYDANPFALQFDHVRGTKVSDIARMTTASLDSLFKEIDKCEVRCANCHSIKTHPHPQIHS